MSCGRNGGQGVSKRVIGVGLACLDQLLIWEDTAAPIEGNKIVASDMQGGGMAATAMVAVSRLGGDAELWTAVGDDQAGDQIIRAAEMDGVNTDQMERVEGGKSMLIVVCVDQKSGERHFKRASDWDRPTHAIGDIAKVPEAGCLLIDHALPESELPAAREAKSHGIPVVSDTGRFGDWQEEILPFVDYPIVSEKGAQSLNDDLREACRSVHSMGAECVVVTLGDKGLIYFDGETFGELPAFKVEVVDTTGAGDVFHGAFCYGLVEGFSLEDNLRFASAVSAMKCTKIGGRAGIPTREQVDVFLAERG